MTLHLLPHQITWTARKTSAILNPNRGEEVLVSYLPLSHVAAQMIDIWVCMSAAGTVYFAEPDALKVKKSFLLWKHQSFFVVDCFLFFIFFTVPVRFSRDP